MAVVWASRFVLICVYVYLCPFLSICLLVMFFCDSVGV